MVTNRMHIVMLLAAICLIIRPASPARAAIMDPVTERGGELISGGADQVESFGLGEMLLDKNNTQVAPPIGSPGGPVDDYMGVEGDEIRIPIGCIIDGPGGAKLTYDQLLAVPVLQVLGYGNYGPQGYIPPAPPEASWVYPQIGGAPIGIASSPQESVFKPIVIPEPASIILLGLGAVMMFSRKRKTI